MLGRITSVYLLIGVLMGFLASGGAAASVTLEMKGAFSVALLFREISDPQATYEPADMDIGVAQMSLMASLPWARVSEVGVHVVLEAVEVEEVYAYVDGPYGVLRLGGGEDMAETLHYTAPALGANGVDDPDFYPLPQISARMETLGALSGEENKISYMTPRLFGWKLGVSYTPRVAAGVPRLNGVGTPERGGVGDVGSITVNFLEGISLDTLGVVHMGFSVSFMGGKRGGGEDPLVWKVGGNLAWKGIVMGGSYYADEHVAGVGVEDTVWTLGLRADVGLWTLGTAYRQSVRTAPARLEARNAAWQWGIIYHMGPGFQIGLQGQFVEDQSPAPRNTEAWETGFMTMILF